MMLSVDEADVLQRPVLAPLLAESLAAMRCSVVVRGEAVASRRRALMLMLHAATKGRAATARTQDIMLGTTHARPCHRMPFTPAPCAPAAAAHSISL
jgi:hypothetical protein